MKKMKLILAQVQTDFQLHKYNKIGCHLFKTENQLNSYYEYTGLFHFTLKEIMYSLA